MALAERLFDVRIEAVHDNPRLAWADGLLVSVPRTIAQSLPGGEAGRAMITATCSSAATEIIDEMRFRAAFTPAPPASSRLPFSYQTVPLPVRTLIGHAIGRVQRANERSWASYPKWPLDLSVDFISDLCNGPPAKFAAAPAPVLLSHDIDTDEGLRNLVHSFLAIEESVNAHSTNYIVPCAWSINHDLLEQLVSRGHELGIHGYDHSNRTPFATPDERRGRIKAAKPLIERYGITGYRAPSLLRTEALLADLEGFYEYDSSIPTSGGLFPVPNNGCASARPFRIGKLLELPLTMPRDGSLMFLGHSPSEILTIWKACAERIAASGGIVTLLTHCEGRFSGNVAMLSAYRSFLEYLSEDPRYAFSQPSAVMKQLA